MTLKKYFLVTIGTISLILGAIGLFIPLLPTTPFVLLTSYCYLRSSNRLYNWIINNKVFGNYIHNYMINKAVKKSDKISAMIMLWISLGISIYFIDKTYLKLLLVFIGTAVSIHVLRLKTLKSNIKIER